MKGAFAMVLLAVSIAGGAEMNRWEKWKAIGERFAPTEMKVDLSSFSPREKQAIFKLVQAAQVIDEIFWDQQGPDVAELRKQVQNGRDDLKLAFGIYYGPYDEQEDDAMFFGDKPRLPGITFYPPDMTKEAFAKYIAGNPAVKDAFESPYTVIARDGKVLNAIPYHDVHKEKVEQAAMYLEEACLFLDDPALIAYIRQRAADLRTDDYFKSDCDWIDLKNNRIEIVIGPYEVYEDKLLGLKAAYEVYVYTIDREGSAKLSTFVENIGYIQESLPIPEELRKSPPGLESPLRVVDLLFAGGDARQGVQTVAFNLPNDQRVLEQKGSKKIMLKNLLQAKFDKILVPMAKVILGSGPAELVTFEPFFNNILLHEISHALGVVSVTKPDGTRTTPNHELKELYPAMEEAKADVVGLYAMQKLMDKKVLPPEQERTVYLTGVASIFRSIRFGVAEAHGAASMIQLNFLIKEGALTREPVTGAWKVDVEKSKAAFAKLAAELLRIQYQSDYAGAAKLLADFGKMTPEVQRSVAECSSIPVDIRPIYEYDAKPAATQTQPQSQPQKQPK